MVNRKWSPNYDCRFTIVDLRFTDPPPAFFMKLGHKIGNFVKKSRVKTEFRRILREISGFFPDFANIRGKMNSISRFYCASSLEYLKFKGYVKKARGEFVSRKW